MNAFRLFVFIIVSSPVFGQGITPADLDELGHVTNERFERNERQSEMNTSRGQALLAEFRSLSSSTTALSRVVGELQMTQKQIVDTVSVTMTERLNQVRKDLDEHRAHSDHQFGKLTTDVGRLEEGHEELRKRLKEVETWKYQQEINSSGGLRVERRTELNFKKKRTFTREELEEFLDASVDKGIEEMNKDHRMRIKVEILPKEEVGDQSCRPKKKKKKACKKDSSGNNNLYQYKKSTSESSSASTLLAQMKSSDNPYSVPAHACKHPGPRLKPEGQILLRCLDCGTLLPRRPARRPPPQPARQSNVVIQQAPIQVPVPVPVGQPNWCATPRVRGGAGGAFLNGLGFGLGQGLGRRIGGRPHRHLPRIGPRPPVFRRPIVNNILPRGWRPPGPVYSYYLYDRRQYTDNPAFARSMPQRPTPPPWHRRRR